MVTLAEVADKVFPAGGILLLALVVAAVFVGMAMFDRRVGVVVFLVALLFGGVLAINAAADARQPDDIMVGIWRELGWPWVLTYCLAPLLPAASVGIVLIVRTRRGRREKD